MRMKLVHAARSIAACWILLAIVPSAPVNAADPVTSVWQGAYTKAQATRGQTLYLASCSSCHGATLQGDTDAPDLAGGAFVKRWTGRSVGVLFGFTESQMPVGRPRGLGAQGYADVIAHMLAANGYPDGPEELPSTTAVLDKIMIDTKK
jgi:mono/diheme cytochrome c family protein